ncbi:MAG: hypothetical protein PUH81_07590 [Clostridiales bacterium]|nr:hypothetical protein [Clostridiales bacterium]MDY5468969.1 hypothetical protein [Eubacteriales bacterium]
MYKDEKFNDTIPLNTKNFQKILLFYLFNCPAADTSIRADTFAQRGWKKELYSTLKSDMLNAATPNLRKHYCPCTKDNLESTFAQMESLDETEEYCVFLKHEERKVMDSLYRAIRNAFAHGSFTRKKKKKEFIYFFANYDGYLKAQIQLKESTLLAWIGIINSGPHSHKRA